MQKYYPDLLWPTKERKARKKYRNKEKVNSVPLHAHTLFTSEPTMHCMKLCCSGQVMTEGALSRPRLRSG